MVTFPALSQHGTSSILPLVSSAYINPISVSEPINGNLVPLGADLDALNTYLGGVQNYVVDGLVSTRRQALATYLGVVA